MNTMRRVVLLVCVTVSALAEQLPKFSQWPVPDPNAPVISMQERKAMLPETAEHHAEMVAKLMKAIAQKDRATFLFRGTANFQKSDPKVFDVLITKWAERFGDGTKVSPIAEIYKGFATSLWRVQFIGGGDEALIVLETDGRGNIVHFQII